MDTPPSPWTAWERNFATQMQRLREMRKMTQTDLARELQRYGLRFHQQTVQRIEAGERPVRLNEAYVIADVFNVDLRSMTVSGTPADRDVLYAVDRLRRESGNAATNLEEALWEWVEGIEPLGVALSERLLENPDQADEVTRWGLAWVMKALWAYDNLAEAITHLIEIEGSPARIHAEDPTVGIVPSPDVIKAMLYWIGRYQDDEIAGAALGAANQLQAAFPSPQHAKQG